MSSSTTALSFVIPVRNDADRLRRCLASIRASAALASVEIIVVDNGSTDASVAVAESAGARVLHMPGERVAALRNAGAQVAGSDLLAFVDADNELGRDWYQAGTSLLADRSVSAVGDQYHAPPSGTRVQRMYDRLRRRRTGRHEVDWLPSGNLIVRRTAFERVGGFDVSLETCEDVDLCRRLRSHGYALVADSRLENIHYGDPETLGDVFLGELWRGRDNIRVSLRSPRTWRTLTSAAIPAVTLLALIIAIAGLAYARMPGLAVAGLAALALLLLVGLRAAVMLRAFALRDLLPAAGVAVAYEFGRALAVAAKFGYSHRRKGAAA